MTPPQLAGPGRRALVGQLVALAGAQAAIAAAAAQALGRTMAAPPSQLEAAAAITAGLAVLTGAALLAERSLAERLAQSLIFDTRAALFESVIARARGTSEERWLTPFVGDLAALRTWAARGIIRLWTSAIASIGAALWLAIAYPAATLALAPLLLGLLLVMLGALRLHRVIGDQRAARGRLTRFLIRRVRAEVAGKVAPGRHGRRELGQRAAALACLALCRTRWAAAIEGVMLAAAGLAALALVVAARQAGASAADLVAGLALIGFAGARLVEFARALHAHLGGRIALARVQRLLGSGDSAKDGDRHEDA
jgi:ABC-type multidrug transport system fused ATPase/permease subunit